MAHVALETSILLGIEQKRKVVQNEVATQLKLLHNVNMRYRLMYRLHDDRKVQTNVASAIKEYKQVNGKKLPKSARNLGM